MRMSFIVNHKELWPALAAMQPICSRRTTLAATTGILLHSEPTELILKSTDLEISLQASVSIIESSSNQAWSCILPGKRLYDVLKDLDGEITFIYDSGQIRVISEGMEVILHTQDPQDFPPLPERIENLCAISSKLLLQTIDAVAFVVPQANANPALNGVCLEIDPRGMRMTATDGHSLAQGATQSILLEKEHRWLLPRRAVFELKKIMTELGDETVFLGTCGSQLVFSGQRFNFFTKLLQVAFPEYRQVLSKDGFIPAHIDRNHLMRALKRSASLLTGQFLPTRFTFKHNELLLNFNNKEVGAVQEKVAVSGLSDPYELQMRLYAPYLLAGMQGFEESLSFFIASSNKPIIFESITSELKKTYLVMPVSPHAHEETKG